MSERSALKPRPAKRNGAGQAVEEKGCGLVRTNTEMPPFEAVALAQNEVFHLSPHDLGVHPDLAEVAGLNEQEVEQLRQSIIEAGRVIQPLVITSARQIIDGRHRRFLAQELGVEKVPCIVDDAVDALDLAISSALDRRHLSQGQRALYIFKLHRVPRQQRAESGPDNKISASEGAISLISSLEHYDQPSFRELSRRYGVDDHLFAWLSQMWHNSSPEEWREIVRVVESGEQKLKSVYHGFGGRQRTKGQTRPPERLDKQSARFLTAIKTYARKWDRLDLQDRTDFIIKLVGAVAAASPSMADTLVEALQQARTSQP